MKYKLKEFDYFVVSPLFIKDFEREEHLKMSKDGAKKLDILKDKQSN